jgi:hypothetical protein
MLQFVSTTTILYVRTLHFFSVSIIVLTILQVEEISEVDCFTDVKCFDEAELSEEQRRKYRKVS